MSGLLKNGGLYSKQKRVIEIFADIYPRFTSQIVPWLLNLVIPDASGRYLKWRKRLPVIESNHAHTMALG